MAAAPVIPEIFRRRRAGRREFLARNILGLPGDLVEHAICRGARTFRNAYRVEDGVQQPPVTHPRTHIPGTKSELLHDPDGNAQQLGVRQIGRAHV